jgi:two-component system sensor kinase FixL
MACQTSARRGSERVVELVQLGRKAANDPARRMRLEALEGLAPTLIHELSQPLAATANYLDVCVTQIRQKIAGLEDVLEGIERARAQAARAGEIIRSMRNFALRGEVAGKSEELRRIVNEALAAVPGIETVDVSLSYHAAGVYVIVDRVQFRQVLTNLATNAVEAMAGSRVRQLRIVTSETDAGCTRIRIEDSGPGLSWGVFTRLFEPFVTTKAQGTGLGLPICNAIVEAHRGRLWAATPEAGHGAVFNLLIPARIKAEAL